MESQETSRIHHKDRDLLAKVLESVATAESTKIWHEASTAIQNELEELSRINPTGLSEPTEKKIPNPETIETAFEMTFSIGHFHYILQVQLTENGWRVTNSNQDSFQEILRYLQNVKDGGNWLQTFGSKNSTQQLPGSGHTHENPSDGMPAHTWPLKKLQEFRQG